MQKSAIRVLEGVKYEIPCQILFKKHNIVPVPCLFILETLKTIHNDRDKFTVHSDILQYNTRNAGNLMQTFSRIGLSKKNTLDVGLYNKFTNFFKGKDIKNMNLYSFKTFAKSFLVSHCFYSIDDFVDYLSNNEF